MTAASESRRHRIFLAGATGYIGRHVARELAVRGHEVVCFCRDRSGTGGRSGPEQTRQQLTGCEVRFGDVTCPVSLSRDGFRGEPFDAVVSCMASRSGGIEDSWRVDYRANRGLLDTGRTAGARHFVLLSAICVQNPRLAFQFAKLRMERELIESGLTYSIVRPTAFFKSLAGQVEAVQRGRPYLMFGDGLTACRPIAEADLAAFMVDCLEDDRFSNRILPVGGPDEAITARERGELLFELTGRPARFRRIPLRIFDGVIPVLNGVARLFPRAREKAEFARIAQYYASESMLLLDPETGCYDGPATPVYGRRTLREFYASVLRNGLQGQELGEHRLFSRANQSTMRND